MRYAVLKHTGHGETHFDLLLEIEGQERLRTVQLRRWPLAVGETVEARGLLPHRRTYLEYEGEVSGGRGTVRRVEDGRYVATPEEVVVESSRGEKARLLIRDDAVERVG